MELKRLDWDCRFFGVEVFGVHLYPEDLSVDVHGIVRSLRGAGADLAYFFLEDVGSEWQGLLSENGAILYDEKITYGKELMPKGPVHPNEILAYEGAPGDELLELAFLAGHESRFRKDPRLSPDFEKLYTLWMKNSLNGLIADKVFIYGSDPVKGMATCRIGDGGMGSIGLIATGAAHQGKGVGRGLLLAADHFFRANGVKTATVVTQRANKQACLFYEKEGFTVLKTELVYHLWFN
jgi:dTDP-4-amino-4,6-dideoxy-D-galactose acyltransferase